MNKPIKSIHFDDSMPAVTIEQAEILFPDAHVTAEPDGKVTDVILNYPTDAEDQKKDDDEGFNWNDDESIILQEQPATAAYQNNAGGLTIRQERRWNEDEDPIVVISPENVATFLDRLTDRCGVQTFGGPRPKKAGAR